MDLYLYRFQSLLGVAAFPALLWACSKHKRQFPARLAAWALLLQFLVAAFLLRTQMGSWIFAGCNGIADRLTEVSLEGARIVFGPLASGAALEKAFGAGNAHIFAVWVAAVITVVSAFVALLEHWSILPRMVQLLARALQSSLRSSGAESLNAAANLFMGHTESIIAVRAYVETMTRSEVFSVMSMGMATLSAGAVAVYAKLGDGAGHLVTATLLSVIGGILCSKILLPQTEESPTRAGAALPPARTYGTAVEAVCTGAQHGLTLALSVLAMLIAFTALVAAANIVLVWGQSAGGVAHPWKLENILGWIHAPVAWLMGVPLHDCLHVGEVLGTRAVLNEFLGYLSLAELRTVLSPRAFTLATYALSGFANPASVGMVVAAIGSAAPGRLSEAASLGGRALLVGLCTSYLTTAVAGVWL